MRKIGLTGGIGSGKSYVALLFKHLGIAIFNADDAGKQALLQTEVKERIVAVFGNSILDENNEINKSKLAEKVFVNAESLKQLTDITHPYILTAFNEFCVLHAQDTYVIMEAAILLESGFNLAVDHVIHVTAPLSIRINRVMLRDNISAKEIEKRINLQYTDVQRKALSDYEIMNDETRLLIPQVLALHTLFNKYEQ